VRESRTPRGLRELMNAVTAAPALDPATMRTLEEGAWNALARRLQQDAQESAQAAAHEVACAMLDRGPARYFGRAADTAYFRIDLQTLTLEAWTRILEMTVDERHVPPTSAGRRRQALQGTRAVGAGDRGREDGRQWLGTVALARLGARNMADQIVDDWGDTFEAIARVAQEAGPAEDAERELVRLAWRAVEGRPSGDVRVVALVCADARTQSTAWRDPPRAGMCLVFAGGDPERVATVLRTFGRADVTVVVESPRDAAEVEHWTKWSERPALLGGSRGLVHWYEHPPKTPKRPAILGTLRSAEELLLNVGNLGRREPGATPA
jgi:hypothetical protein